MSTLTKDKELDTLLRKPKIRHTQKYIVTKAIESISDTNLKSASIEKIREAFKIAGPKLIDKWIRENYPAYDMPNSSISANKSNLLKELTGKGKSGPAFSPSLVFSTDVNFTSFIKYLLANPSCLSKLEEAIDDEKYYQKGIEELEKQILLRKQQRKAK